MAEALSESDLRGSQLDKRGLQGPLQDPSEASDDEESSGDSDGSDFSGFEGLLYSLT